jgi:hypothetical protein
MGSDRVADDAFGALCYSLRESFKREPLGAVAMSDSIRLFGGLAIGVIFLYWAFVVVARLSFGFDLPDPVNVLPVVLREALPRWL